MRILILEFANINALAGTWQIDFTDTAFSNGLFAITGPTGSGKTTLLDAVTLALYGRTARLTIKNKNNDLMTKGTGFCYARLRFDIEGRIYEAVWQQTKSKNGNLQPPQHKLYELSDSGLLMMSGETTKLKETSEKIIEITGLDFHQFTQAVLLAQGSFAAFINADDKEKAKILEELTQGQRFRLISMKVYSLYKEYEKRYDMLSAGSAYIKPLTDDEETTLRLTRVRLAADIATQSETIRQLRLLAEKQQQLTTLQNEEAREKLRLTKAETALAEFKENDEKLRQNDELKPLEMPYSRMKDAEEQLEEVKQNYKAHNERRLKLQDDYEKWRRRHETHSKNLAAAKIRRQQAEADLEKILAAEKEIELYQQRAADHSDKLKEHRAEETRLELYCKNFEKSYALYNELAAKSTAEAAELEQLKKFIQTADTVNYEEKLMLTGQIIEKTAAVNQYKLEKTELKQKITIEKENYDSLKLRLKKQETRHIAAELAGYRHYLRNGEPCPLCGSCEHQLQNIDDTDVSENYYSEKTELELAEKTLMRLAVKAESLEQQTDMAEDTLKRLIKSYSETPVDDWQAEQFRLNQLNNEKKKKFKRYNELRDNYEKLIKLEAQAVQFSEKTERRKKYKSEIESLTNKIYELSELEQQKKAAIASLTGGMTTALFRKHIITTYTEAENAETNSRQKADEYRLNFEKAAALANENKTQIADKELIFKELNNAWLNLLKIQGINEQFYLTGRLSADEEHELKTVKNRLHQEKTDAEAALKKIQELAAVLYKENYPPMLNEKLSCEEKTLENFNKEAALLDKKLADNEQLKNEATRHYQLLEEARQEADNWMKLNELIGSAQGDKFTKLVQHITFRLLLAEANCQLIKLTDRYLLTYNAPAIAASTFEFSVIDAYQDGEPRTIKNLSGGETFIVSLALALGLSSMLSQKRSIDCLFLDEGFGTLDEESLETALNALKTLNTQGKLVGLISHVPLLHEQIETHINVRPLGNGASVLSGAGVSRPSS
jgi:exonuclease SbcC